MGIDYANYAAVNMHSTNIPVYEKLVHSSVHTGGQTVGGSVIGHIHKYEYYCITKGASMYITSYKIKFLDGNNQYKTGYIETSPGTTLGYYAWHDYQKPYHLYNSSGNTLVGSTQVTINGTTYRVFKTHRKLKCIDSNANELGYIPSGTTIACNTSTIGATKNNYMVFKYKKNSSGNWVKIFNKDYVFVNLHLTSGTMPNNRAIR